MGREVYGKEGEGSGISKVAGNRTNRKMRIVRRHSWKIVSFLLLMSYFADL